MTNRFTLVLLTMVLPFILAGVHSSSAQDDQGFVASMQIVDIGLPEGSTEALPVAINVNGDVLVNATVDGEPAVFVYRNGAYLQLGGEDASASGAAINDSGSVAGWSEAASGTSAVLIGQESLVEMPGDGASSQAFGINAQDMLVGAAVLDEAGGDSAPVFWTSTKAETLPTVGEGASGAVRDVNTIEQMVGWSALDAEGTTRHATLWEDGAATDLGTLGGPVSEARAISETGHIVGASTTASGQTELESPGTTAVSWIDGQVVDLGLAEAYAWGIANDVNDVGMIVGTVGLLEATPAGYTTLAVLWTGGELLDLNTITTGGDGLTLVEGIGVNALGQILCRAIDSEGNSRIAVLSVIGN